jgi:hypothetical protein
VIDVGCSIFTLLNFHLLNPNLCFSSSLNTSFKSLTFKIQLLNANKLSRSAEKVALGHVALEGDLEWTPETTLVYPILAVGAGIAAGLLGIGGTSSRLRRLLYNILVVNVPH